jgi:PAS domain S-box-containing protein
MSRDDTAQESQTALSPKVEAELLRLVMDSTKGLVFEIDAGMRYLNVWTEREELLARPWAEVQGRTIEEVLGPEAGAPYAALVRRVLATGERETLEYSMQVSQGLRWFAADVRRMPRIADRPPSVVFIARDITEKKLAAEALRESQERYRLLFDLSPLPSWLVDEETLRFLEVNEAASLQYGYSHQEFLQRSLRDIHAASNDEQFRAIFASRWPPGVRQSVITRHRKRDGTLIDVEVHFYTLMLGMRRTRFAVIFDITGRLTLEEQLRRAQKMEALGRLAGGIAHDFNNLLSVILGWSEFLLGSMPEDDKRRTEVDEILGAGRRAAALTGQLLTFSRKQVLKPQRLDPDDLVAGTVKMLARLLGENIRLTTGSGSCVPRIMADRGQVEQVLVNLAINARDAMPAGGSLHISTAEALITEASARRLSNLRPGRYAAFSVRDTGCGMDEKTLSSIFEPFFTTKEQGKGTGLGLATAFGTVTQSGGSITVDSKVGEGSTFTIYLPAVEEMSVPAPATIPTPRSGEVSATTVLLVEDEEALRRVVKRMLESAGHRVLAAASGEEALGVFEREGASIDLVLTDIVMPGMDGVALTTRITQLRKVKVLFMSGYSEHASLRKTRLVPGVNFLQKPFAAADLRAILQRVLPRKG